MKTDVCLHHWIYRGPGLRECRDCLRFEEQIPPLPACQPYCTVLPETDMGALRCHCDTCGNAWEIRPITEVEPDGTPVQTLLAWAPVSVWVDR